MLNSGSSINTPFGTDAISATQFWISCASGSSNPQIVVSIDDTL